MISKNMIREALIIRKVEERFLELFSQGNLNGTVHTCVGQEFSAVAFGGQLKKNDFIFSNHRCHGHYISYTRDYETLIAELMGKKHGTCGGIGSSQHLCNSDFYSNGIQGGIVPVAAGLALARKLKNSNNIGIVFIGDGTLGEGIVYETLNIISKWNIPLLVVCENNFYAQSTQQHINLAGDILKRAEAFGIHTSKSDVWATEELIKNAKNSIEYVRKNSCPAFHLVETYRLNPHSKGDDDRDINEIDKYKQKDPINVYKKNNPAIFEKLDSEITEKINKVVENCFDAEELQIEQYYSPYKYPASSGWEDISSTNERQVKLLNSFFHNAMSKNNNMVFIGEDVLSPYGGAFKVAKELSTVFPDRVFSTPISEAAITGISNGLALGGFRPFLEIMFGDFMTLCMDQIINHASKFYHMYNKQIKCPIVIRTPMGGRRGYGPTHSQTLDKFLVGIDNVTTVALNILIDPNDLYTTILEKEEHPSIVIENKIDYGKKIGAKKLKNYIYEKTISDYPVVRIKPVKSVPTCTIATYGGMVDVVQDAVCHLFMEHDLKPEIIVLSKLHPLDCTEIIQSVNRTKKLYVVEEGSSPFGVGSEIIASVIEQIHIKIIARRIASLPVPIPSVKSLEHKVLPGVETIINTIKETLL